MHSFFQVQVRKTYLPYATVEILEGGEDSKCVMNKKDQVGSKNE